MCYSSQKCRTSVQLWESIREIQVEGQVTKKPINLLQNKYQGHGSPGKALTLPQPVADEDEVQTNRGILQGVLSTDRQRPEPEGVNKTGPSFSSAQTHRASSLSRELSRTTLGSRGGACVR